MRGVGLTRRRLLRATVGVGAAVAAFPRLALGKDTGVPHAVGLAVRGAAKPFAGDRPMFVTIAPGSEGRDTATVLFRLATAGARPARRRSHRDRHDERPVDEGGRARPRGARDLLAADADVPVGSYVMRLTIEGNGGRRVYGRRRPASPERASAPVVRVLGIEAAFTRRSYLPTERMALRVLADVPSFTLTFLRIGYGPDPSLRNDEMVGLEMGAPVAMDWSGKRSARQTVVVQSGDWPSGLYAARLEAPDGRVGFAPFVLRATTPGGTRTAVVLPTNTWQAYNLYDADGDGWGDTWYAGGMPPVVLDRPYRDRGVPPRFRRYDFPFVRWLEKTRS